jgi:glycerol-3-phosphate dehydrogenase
VDTWPVIERADVEYVLRPVARDLTADPVAPEEVVAAWAGLRPLIGEEGKSPSEISRKDEVWVGPCRVVTIAGGKLTGYRPMAHLTLERAAEACGLSPAPAPPDEREEPLPGGQFDGELGGLAASLCRQGGLSRARAHRLARCYGSEAQEVLARGAEPLTPGALPLRGEVAWAVEVEAALRLEDFVFRRSGAGYYEVGDRDGLLAPAAAEMGALLGWDEARQRAEVEAVRTRLAADLAFRRTA